MVIIDTAMQASWDRLIEEERLAIAAEYELPALRPSAPISLAVTTATWLYTMPASYHKKLFQVRDSDTNGGALVTIHRDLLEIERLDPDHNETQSHVSDVAVENNSIGVFPLATETLSLWYYQRPTTLTADSQSPTEIPSEFHYSVLLPRLVIRSILLYPTVGRDSEAINTRVLDYWRQKSFEGLYGGRTGQIGFLNFLLKNRPPRKHGGRDPLP